MSYDSISIQWSHFAVLSERQEWQSSTTIHFDVGGVLDGDAHPLWEINYIEMTDTGH